MKRQQHQQQQQFQARNKFIKFIVTAQKLNVEMKRKRKTLNIKFFA
jgi:hypothetical protein